MKRILIAICSLLLVFPLLANAEKKWERVEKARKPGEVSTWVRKVKGAAVKEFRGEVELPDAPLRVLLALDTVEDFPKWVYHNQKGERMPAKGVYMQFEGIWPAADRDVLVKSVALLKEDRVRIETTQLDGMVPEQDGFVRIVKLDNSFEVVPLPNGGSKVIFQTFVDLGGILPAWISNVVAKDGPLNTLNDLRKYLEQQPMPDASLDQLSNIYDPIRGDLQTFLQTPPAP
ncbi:MAG: START domain-containing protein [Gammaproteobacteria bacterium]